MIKYLKPKLKIIRKLGYLPGLTKKKIGIRKKTPGQHGKLINLKIINRSFISEEYKKRLIEKQKICYNYGITDNQLYLYYKKVKKKLGSTGILLLIFLESRFDCIIYRLNYTSSIKFAKLLICHGYFLINNKKITSPSFHCKINDIITIKDLYKNKIKINILKNLTQQNLILLKINFYNILKYHNILNIPNHLNFNFKTLTAKIIKQIHLKDFLLKINILKIIEYYSYY